VSVNLASPGEALAQRLAQFLEREQDLPLIAQLENFVVEQLPSRG
jgi:hypothetical protein